MSTHNFDRFHRDAQRLRLSYEDQIPLIAKMKTDPKARARLIEGNLYLVAGIILRHFQAYKAEWDDLALAGAAELIHAIDLFDSEKARLGSYAYATVLYELRTYTNQSLDTVRRSWDTKAGRWSPALRAVGTDDLEPRVRESLLGTVDPVTPSGHLKRLLTTCLPEQRAAALVGVVLGERTLDAVADEMGLVSSTVYNWNRASLEHLRTVISTGRKSRLSDKPKPTTKPRPPATCCPDRPHYSRGLCSACYQKMRYHARASP